MLIGRIVVVGSHAEPIDALLEVMLTRIEGKLESVQDQAVVIGLESTGLAYEVLAPAYLAASLHERLGDTVRLHTIEYYESQGQGTSFIPRVVGFESRAGRRMYEALTTLRGVGPRKALRMLAREPEWIAGALARGDALALRQLPEVGKKLAETMIADLRDHLGEFAIVEGSMEPKPAAAALTGPAEDAVSALVALGQTRRDAEEAVRRALAGDATLATPESIIAAAAGLAG